MKSFRLLSFIAAVSVSTNFLFGDTWRVILPDGAGNQIFPVDLAPNQSPIAEDPVVGITGPLAVVITPDATTAAVSNSSDSPNPNLFQLDLTNTPITIGSTTGSLPDGRLVYAISPDGARIYAPGRSGGDISVAQTSDFSVIGTIPASLFAPYTPGFIALSPNKAEGYVTTESPKLFVIDTDTNTVKTIFNTPFDTFFPVVTPDGTEVYVSDRGSSNLSYVTLSDGFAHNVTGIPSASQTGGIAMAPDGTALYAIQIVDTQFMLTKVDTKTHAFVTQYPIPPQVASPLLFSITPDGKTACIPDFRGNSVAFIDLITGSSTILDIPEAENFGFCAITPDQAPTARFTPTMSGATVTLDASASSSPVGSIATYAWDFGDGQTETTTSPTITHTYATGGTFAVTLTVTNTGGTSTVMTYTGQMTNNNGGPSAQTTQQISVQASGVAKFKGKVHLDRKNKKVYLNADWSKSLIRHTKKYEIFSRNTKIATIKAKHKRHTTLRLHPHHFPHSVSKDYRHYLDHKYNIRAVDALGHISQPTFVHVKK